MSELKTLKDMEWSENIEGYIYNKNKKIRQNIPENVDVNIIELRQSVIEDIQARRNGYTLPIFREDIESYIKWKFNITEDDLK